MLPLELIVANLHRCWQCHGALRMLSNDCQISGYEYCAEGKIADIFLQHAPELAAAVKAHWNDRAFVWEEDGVVKKEYMFLPLPVMRWIDSGHGQGTAERLRVSLAYLNDGHSRWSMEQITDLIRIQFGLGDPLAEAKIKGQKAYSAMIKIGEEHGTTHGHGPA